MMEQSTVGAKGGQSTKNEYMKSQPSYNIISAPGSPSQTPFNSRPGSRTGSTDSLGHGRSRHDSREAFSSGLETIQQDRDL